MAALFGYVEIWYDAVCLELLEDVLCFEEDSLGCSLYWKTVVRLLFGNDEEGGRC